ncbi:pullulanase [Cellvibrio zantedeschiae]|uniref:pullulanase n=2 Tax=Cellvibrio zantedeschiae TaxID=1237077 RepID=A0ABQ3ALN5_9GAMM|nr:pullulanase [Cellvibrio zantedeschiae]
MPAKVADDEAVIYFNKEDKNFAGYTLYTWQSCSPTWLKPSSGWTDESQVIQGVSEAEQDPIYGAYFVVKLAPGGTCGNFIIRSAGQARQTNDLTIGTATTGSPFDRRYFVIADPSDLRNSRVSALPICINDVCAKFEEPKLAISNIAAHWIDASTILWDREVSNVKLYSANDGGKISANKDGSVANGTVVASLSATSINDAQRALVPHLRNYRAYSLNLTADVIKGLLKKELVIVGQTSTGNLVGTRLQTAQILDALYTAGANDANEAKLGVSYTGGNVSASVWAPTATKVELRVYGNDLVIESTKDMTENKTTGIWTYSAAKAELDRKFYRFRVTVFNAFTNKTEVLETTDPESVSLSTNGLHSQFVNLNDSDLKPAGWDGQVVPEVSAPETMSIYETHVRDFSANDQSTPVEHRGKYLAFTDTNAAPVKHLKALADAGLTHVHLLPIADGSSISEDPATQINLDSYVFELCAAQSPRDSAIVCNGVEKPNATLRSVLQKYAGDSTKQRAVIDALRDFDAFNWNYDPEHFNAPDGSYATNAKGVTRILETRAMNLALHNLGLRVVYDVVYPHMAAAGVKTANSTFDKIVPGYYFRQNAISGAVETQTNAGPDTATEHVMAAKFVSDSLVQWASAYKVDGFRFDQSGYMPKSVLVNAYSAVKAVDPDNYFYAEAWTGGSSSGDRIAERASQVPLAGTGIGTFNDVIRNPLRELALVNGGALDRVRAGLAGNLADFRILSKSGKTVKASTVGAYNLDPQEAINYVEKHDNETLWDWMHRPNALPANTTVENRVRIHDMTLAVPLLSQGVPFIQAGSDILRSKSMSSNSYNAGDWFNVLDFTKQTNNWKVGLPPASDTSDANILLAFADEQSKPTPALIQKSSDVFNEILKISKSSPLFSLTTAADVMDRVGFHDGGTTQKSNLIVMSIDDGAGKVTGTQTNRADLDPKVDAIVVIFNGSATAITQKVLTSAGFVLHSIQKTSVDDTTRTASFTEGTGGGSFTVPAYTAAVFVKPQSGAQGAGLSATATSGYEPPVPYGDTALYVRGSVSPAGWDATAANRMKYEGNGIYSVVLDVPAGTNAFKVAEANWSLPNLGSNQAVTVGTPVTLTQGSNDNLNLTVATAGKYRFELNALQSTTAPILTVTNPDTFGATAVYLRGTVSATGWDAAAGNRLVYEGNSIYALKLDLAAGDYVFKVASSDWSTFNLGNASAVTLGAELPIIQGSNDNIPIHITKAGSYRFEVNTRKPDAPVVKVYQDDLFKDTPIYARGTVSSAGWDATSANKFSYKGAGLYTLGLNIAAGNYMFKIAETNWSNPNLGAPSATLGVPTDLVQGSNDNIALSIPTTGDYVFTVDTTKADAITVTVDSK